jgi:hypothetical protein
VARSRAGRRRSRRRVQPRRGPFPSSLLRPDAGWRRRTMSLSRYLGLFTTPIHSVQLLERRHLGENRPIVRARPALQGNGRMCVRTGVLWRPLHGVVGDPNHLIELQARAVLVGHAAALPKLHRMRSAWLRVWGGGSSLPSGRVRLDLQSAPLDAGAGPSGFRETVGATRRGRREPRRPGRWAVDSTSVYWVSWTGITTTGNPSGAILKCPIEGLH